MVSLLLHSSILLVLAFQVCSWSNNSILSIQSNRFSLLISFQSKESEIYIDEEDIQPKVEYGVSYIGGDPCGSKYNTDPFDVKVTKPGMPDDMKSRIQALANKKIKAMKEESDKEE